MSLKTLLPISVSAMPSMSNTCYCGKNRSYEKCCGRFISGVQFAKTVEQLMRSRYSAFAQGEQGAYLLATWFPPMAANLDEASLSLRDKQWLGLTVHSSEQQGDKGTVAFSASYQVSADKPVETLHETSVFQRLKGRWFYVGGEVSTTRDD